MAKRTFKERVQRDNRKQADRDFRYRQEATVDSLVDEVDRLGRELKQAVFEGRATQLQAQQADDRSRANEDRLAALKGKGELLNRRLTKTEDKVFGVTDEPLITIAQSEYDDLVADADAHRQDRVRRDLSDVVAASDADSDAKGNTTVKLHFGPPRNGDNGAAGPLYNPKVTGGTIPDIDYADEGEGGYVVEISEDELDAVLKAREEHGDDA